MKGDEMKPTYSIKLLKMNFKYHRERYNHSNRNFKLSKKQGNGMEKIFDKERNFHLRIMNDLAVSIKYLSAGIGMK